MRENEGNNLLKLTQAIHNFSKEKEIIVRLSFDQDMMMIVNIVFLHVDGISLPNCVRFCRDDQYQQKYLSQHLEYKIL